MNRGDQREAHHSGEDVSLEVLGELGVIYREFPIDSEGKWEKDIDVFAKERGYKNVSGRILFWDLHEQTSTFGSKVYGTR